MNISKKKFLFLSASLILFSFFYLIFNNNNSSVNFIELNNTSLEDKINNKEDFTVYIGKPTCQECTEFEPILKNVLDDIDKEIYYYNTDNAREDNEDLMIDLLETLNVKVVPTIINLNNGSIQDKIVGSYPESDLKEFLQK